MAKLIGVYKITCRLTNQHYIGSSVDIKDRLAHHKSRLRSKTHSNSHLQRAWDKYGEGSFIFRILDQIKSKESLIDLEQFYIDLFNSYKEGFNLVPRAESPGYQRNFPEESKQRLRDLFTGRPLSEETKRKISEANKGKKRSPEVIQQIRETSRNISDETRLKMSISSRNRERKPHTESTREQLRQINLGKSLSKETKEKIRIAGLGKEQSAETREKIRQSLLDFHARKRQIK